MSTLNGKLKVKQNGNYVVIHPETESSLITDFANAVTNTIPIATRANNTAYEVGDCVFVKGLPSWAYLECTQAGTTDVTAPSTITDTVTFDTEITDGTVTWVVRKHGIPSNPALRSIIDNKIAADSLLYGTGANTFAITALSSLARTLLSKNTPEEMRSLIGAVDSSQSSGGDSPKFATDVINAIGKQSLSALGVKYSMTENGYICFGQLFGGLILQWMQGIIESSSTTDYRYYPIKYTSKVFATAVSQNELKYASCGCWVKNVDKSKFLIGINSDYDAPSSAINIISIGF